ncbi:MAG TPA: hypothetical protein VIJ64_05265 [Candidatus Lustribacter sp.]
MIARIPHSVGPATLEMISAANPGWKVELEADGSITWISAERWNAVPSNNREEYAHIVPDVAKPQRYRRYGAAYVLLIDPYKRTTWSDGTLPPGFPTDFTSVFDAGTV